MRMKIFRTLCMILAALALGAPASSANDDTGFSYTFKAVEEGLGFIFLGIAHIDLIALQPTLPGNEVFNPHWIR